MKKGRSQAEKSNVLVKELTKSVPHICLLFLLLRPSALASYTLVSSKNPVCKHKFQAVRNSNQPKSAWQAEEYNQTQTLPMVWLFPVAPVLMQLGLILYPQSLYFFMYVPRYFPESVSYELVDTN